LDFLAKINEILRENMSDLGYKFWSALEKKIPNVWNKPTSSTGKYHKRANGVVPSQGEHVWEMLYVCSKLLGIFNIEKNTTEADTLLLAISLHDCLKYGVQPEGAPHTDHTHDQRAADMVNRNKEIFLKILNEGQTKRLEETIRYHSGRWSTDARENFDFENLHPYALFVHMLDMLSTADLIKITGDINDLEQYKDNT